MAIKRAEINMMDQSSLNQTEALTNTCSVAVINTTTISGYASKVTNILEQSGARVIRVGTLHQQDEISQSLLAYNQTNESCIKLKDDLQNSILPVSVQLADSDQTQKLLNRYRADMVLLLAQDQLQSLWEIWSQ
jgi:cell division GTPase FtsZ